MVALTGVAVALHARFAEDGAAPCGDCGIAIGCCSSGGGVGDAILAHLRIKKTARKCRAFSLSSLCAAARARLLTTRCDGSRLRESPPSPPVGLGLPGSGLSCLIVHVTVPSAWTRKEWNSSLRAIAAACRMPRRAARPKFGRHAGDVRGGVGDERLCDIDIK